MSSDAIFRDEFPVPPEAVDGSGHVNNVAYVQWMQDVAIKHNNSVGGSHLCGSGIMVRTLTAR